MSERWIYRLNNEEFGPIVSEQIVELIRSQILTSTDWIRAESSSGWCPLGRFDDFRAELEKARSGDLEIADSLDDLTFEFADTSSSNSGLDAAGSRGGRNHGDVVSDPASSSNNVAIAESIALRAPVNAPALHDGDTETPGIERSGAEADTDVVSENDMNQVGTRRSPAIRKPSPQSPAGVRKKAKRKIAKPEDPLLDEIIRELSERGKTEAPTRRASSAQAPTQTAVSPLSAAPTVSAAAGATALTEVRPASNSTAPVSNMTTKMNLYTPPAIRPAPVRVKQSFQMPEPKTIGIIGGGLISAFLVTAMMLGWISLPFGSSGGALSGNAGTVVSCYLEFKQFGTAIPASSEWAAFRLTVEKNIKPVVETSADAKDDVTEAGRKLMELASLQPAGNPEIFKKIGSELDALIAGIADNK